MEFQFDNERPIYLQLVDTLRRGIVSRAVAPGERLPSVRELAAKARVNPNTMQKALLELESEGLIFTERTNGKFVTSDEAVIAAAQRALANEVAQRYLRGMEALGFSAGEAAAYLTKEEHL